MTNHELPLYPVDVNNTTRTRRKLAEIFRRTFNLALWAILLTIIISCATHSQASGITEDDLIPLRAKYAEPAPHDYAAMAAALNDPDRDIGVTDRIVVFRIRKQDLDPFTEIIRMNAEAYGGLMVRDKNRIGYTRELMYLVPAGYAAGIDRIKYNTWYNVTQNNADGKPIYLDLLKKLPAPPQPTVVQSPPRMELTTVKIKPVLWSPYHKFTRWVLIIACTTAALSLLCLFINSIAGARYTTRVQTS